MLSNQKDIDALLERATEYESVAERAADPAEKALNLWLAANMRAKAKQVADQPAKSD